MKTLDFSPKRLREIDKTSDGKESIARLDAMLQQYRPAIRLVIPGTPPSVNHYVKHTRSGRHYKTDAAQLFYWDVFYMSNGQTLCNRQRKSKNRYAVVLQIYRGAKQKGDIDNYAKLPLDALRDALVIHSDDAVDELQIFKFRDAANPRTVITVSVIEGSK